MDECRISNPLARFLILLAVDPKLYYEFQANKSDVMDRPEYGLDALDKAALTSGDPTILRFRLDNIQIHP